MNGEMLQSGEMNQWVYPELQIGFGNAYFQPGEDLDQLVLDVLENLDDITEYVAVEVVKQTHWTSLRNLLNLQVAAWRINDK